MTLLMMFINWSISRSKQQLNPASPEASSSKNAIFRQRWSFFNWLSSLALVFLFLFMQITIIYQVNPEVIPIISLIIPILIVAGAVVVSFTTGQGGSRIKRDAVIGKQTGAVPVDDDRFWKLGGSTYYNPEDPSIFIEKRIGIGWTANFARPMAWVFVFAPILVIILLLIFAT